MLWEQTHYSLRQSATLFPWSPYCCKSVLLEMKVQRIECKDCHCNRQENIHFATGKRSYTNRMARLVVELSRIGTIKDVAHSLHLSWDTVKDIQKRYTFNVIMVILT